MRTFSVILALDLTNGISKEGKIPWYSEDDIKHFEELTTGHIVIMGRKTHELIGKNLSDRVNIVVSQNYSLDMAFVETLNYSDKKVFIIGDAQLYNEVFINIKYRRFIRYVYSTIINKIYNCDTNVEKFEHMFQRIEDKTIDEGIIVTYVNPNIDELNYLNLIKHTIKHGHDRNDRTNVGTKALFGVNMTFNISENRIPLLTTKFVSFKTIFHELKWFLNGICSIEYMQKNKVKIWDKNVEANEGKVGPMYPWQWRHSGADYQHDEIQSREGIDQIANIINLIRTDPMSRRILLCNWNPSDVPKGCLPPCHITFQVFVHGEDNSEISGLLNMRSSDLALGLSYNCVSYAVLLHMLAHVTKKKATALHLMLGDAHIYKNHFDAVEVQCKRKAVSFPTIKITKETDNIDDITVDDFILFDYEHEPRIFMEMAT
tara:strand:- start:2696 stop:3988 length:1293 start_codon:yes stop_codon:yes gene_type:complete